MGLRRYQILAAAVLALGAVGYLVFTGMQDTMVFYYTVSEVVAEAGEFEGASMRVAGKVVPGSIEVSTSNHLDRSFVIHEGGQQIPVEYHGVVPDTLVDDAEAVVEGHLDAEGVFHATFVMAKCPSKYESEGEYDSYPEAGVAATGQTSP